MATEAFALVAEETGRSRGTVQTAYYRVARSLPDGGGVKQRPRRKSKQRATRGATRSVAPVSRGSASNGRRGTRGSQAASATALARQLGSAVEGLVAHVVRLEWELASARADSARLATIERALKR